MDKDPATSSAAQLRLLSNAMEELCCARSQEDLLRISANAAARACSVTGLSIVLASGEQFEYSQHDKSAALSLAIESKAVIRTTSWAMQSTQTAVVPDVQLDERTRSHTNDAAQARSLVVVPVAGAKPFAAIAWSWSQEHWASPSEVQVLEALARATALSLAYHLSQQQIEQRALSSGVLDWLDDAAELEGVPGEDRARWAAIAELQHRVRHVLSLVRSLINRTSESNGSPEYAAHLEGRIAALSRAQAFLMHEPRQGVDLATLAEAEIAALAPPDRRVKIRGPRVRLLAKATETLGLALHELAHNALKFGALASATGRIQLTWTEDLERDPPMLMLEWLESGVQIATPIPTHRGFGRDLIERTVPYELRGSSHFGFEPGGIRCVFEVPLTADNVVTKHAAIE